MTCTEWSFANAISSFTGYSDESALEKESYTIPMFQATAPHMIRECELLKYFYKCDGGRILVNAKKNENHHEESVLGVARLMVESFALSESEAAYVCEQFWCAITGERLKLNFDLPQMSSGGELEVYARQGIIQSEPSGRSSLPATKSRRITIGIILVVALIGLVVFLGTKESSNTNSEIHDVFADNMSIDEIYNRADDYFYGEGVEQNYIEAIKWYRVAAERGDPGAQTQLGYIYLNGYGVDVDYEESAKWYSTAAEQGYDRAQHSIGWLYEKGYGVPQSYFEAAQWYRAAAEQGLAESQDALAYLYEKGYGVPQSYSEARKWYQLAAEQGYMYSQATLGSMSYYGIGTELDYEQAFYWFKLAAEQGETVSQKKLGEMYENGYGVERNSSEAEKWYRLADEAQ